MSLDKKTVTQREWVIALGIAVATAVLCMIPYLLGGSLVPEGKFYTQLIMNPEDSQTYWAKMLQGYNGSLVYTIPFTSEPHDGTLIGAFYVWLGLAGKLFGLSLTNVWHWSRTVAALILYLVTFRFVAEFLIDRTARWTAFLLAIFGSGLGWFLLAIGQPYWLINELPVDFKQPGAHLFFTALTYPHISLGTAVILFDMLVLKRIGDWRLETGSWKLVDSEEYQARKSKIWLYAAAAGFANILLGVVYPFLIYIVALTALFYWLYLCRRSRTILWQQALMIAVMFIIPAPLYLYYLNVWINNDIFRAWDAQAGTPAFPLPHYLISFGIMLALALWYWWKKPEERRHFAILWMWILAAFILLYSPLNAQRRFIQGVHVAFSVLAAAGLVLELLPRAQRSWTWMAIVTRPRYTTEKLTRFILIIFLLFMALSNIYLILDVTRVAVLDQPDLFFRPTDELDAALWLKENAPDTAVVMADYQSGNFIAAHAGQRVVLGHWAETVDFPAKETAVAKFYASNASADLKEDLIEDYNISYVWYGPREQALGNFDPAADEMLRPVYSNGSITIYAVTPQK